MDFRCWFTDFVKTIATTFIKSFSKWEALFMPRKSYCFISAILIATKNSAIFISRMGYPSGNFLRTAATFAYMSSSTQWLVLLLYTSMATGLFFMYPGNQSFPKSSAQSIRLDSIISSQPHRLSLQLFCYIR